jgi:hypothetical protein
MLNEQQLKWFLDVYLYLYEGVKPSLLMEFRPVTEIKLVTEKGKFVFGYDEEDTKRDLEGVQHVDIMISYYRDKTGEPAPEYTFKVVSLEVLRCLYEQSVNNKSRQTMIQYHPVDLEEEELVADEW